MKHWKGAIGFLVTGIIAIVGFFVVAHYGELPEWLSTIFGVVAMLCNGLGIAFINPFAKRDDTGNIISK